MSRSAIRSTVQNAIDEAIASANAGSYVTPLLQQVKDAAVEQVSADIDTLIDEAQSTLTEGAVRLGATRSQVASLFEQAGVNNDPEPEPEAPAVEETFTVTKSMWDRVESALSWARGRGFNG